MNLAMLPPDGTYVKDIHTLAYGTVNSAAMHGHNACACDYEQLTFVWGQHGVAEGYVVGAQHPTLQLWRTGLVCAWPLAGVSAGGARGGPSLWILWRPFPLA